MLHCERDHSEYTPEDLDRFLFEEVYLIAGRANGIGPLAGRYAFIVLSEEREADGEPTILPPPNSVVGVVGVAGETTRD